MRCISILHKRKSTFHNKGGAQKAAKPEWVIRFDYDHYNVSNKNHLALKEFYLLEYIWSKVGLWGYLCGSHPTEGIV